MERKVRKNESFFREGERRRERREQDAGEERKAERRDRAEGSE